MTGRIAISLCGLVLAVTACKKKQDEAPKTEPAAPAPTAPTTAPEPVTAPPPAPTTPAAAAPACRPEEELRSWLATAWKLGADQAIDSANCAAGTFPEPGFAISAWITPKDTGKGGADLFDYRFQIVDASGAVLADFADPDADDPRLWLNGSTPKVELADVDGDGAAELVTTEEEIGREDSESSTLRVYQRQGKTLVEVGRVDTRTLDPGMADGGDPEDPNNPYGVDCTAKVTMGQATPGITLEWTSKEGAKAKGRCPSGTQRYVLRAGKLVLE